MACTPARQSASVRGFSLLEMLVVLGIIAFLATLSVPIYKDYVVRARVSELLVVGTPLKLVVAEYAMTHQKFPAMADLPMIAPIQTRLVKRGEIRENGVILIEADPAQLGATLTIRLIPTLDPGGIRWECSSLGDQQFAPLQCR